MLKMWPWRIVFLALPMAVEVAESGISVIVHEQTTFSVDHVRQDGRSRGDGPLSAGNVTCISESGLDFKNIVLVDVNKLAEYSFQECARHCVRQYPDKTHILISYAYKFFLRDDFKCMCANEAAIAATKKLSPSKCVKDCPKSHRRCGDPHSGVLSVYCTHRSCSAEARTPICSSRLPHDTHGCITANRISWAHAHNVRNFSAALNGHSACVWECHDHHPSAMYSLTRAEGDVLTCSCAYVAALEPFWVMQDDYCSMLTDDDPFYTVNCVTDLDENVGTDQLQAEANETCKSIYPVGCIYEELLVERAPIIRLTNWAKPTPQSCHAVCSATFRTSAFHVGIRWQAVEKELQCVCLRPGDWNASFSGPNSACDTDCYPKGTGLKCGGSSTDSRKGFPAFSLYCRHDGDESIEESSENEEAYLELAASKPLLLEVDRAIATGSVAAEIIVVFFAILCILLIGIVIYLCYARGISSLSKCVM